MGTYFRAGEAQLSAWRPGATAAAEAEAQVIDMFSGCGGMSLGFAALARATGAFELVGAVDVNDVSLNTYRHNFGVPALNRDVRALAGSRKALNDMLRAFPRYQLGRPTVLIGCAPCQGFSAHRKGRWDEVDVRNGLVEAFAEVAAMLEPACVIMENVPELLSGRYWPHFEYFRDRLEKKGYLVKQAIHNAASQGVPQERFRAIVVAMKREFELPIARVEPRDFVTVRDAIGALKPVQAGAEDADDPMHKSASHRASTLEVIKAVPRDGGSRPEGVGPKCLQGFRGFADVYGRLAWDRPAITITHYARNPASGRFIHPEQDRGLTIREAARLQSFPDGFEFTGSFDDLFRQVGEAVPPRLSLAVAASTLANLRGESASGADEALVLSPVNDSYAGVIAGIKSSRR